jgi:hypothetical protein
MDPARIFFHDASIDGQFVRTLACAYSGAADLGEAFATARRIGAKSNDANTWYDEWSKTAIAVEAIGAQAADGRHDVTARNAYLRACEYYRQAYYFMRADVHAPALIQAYNHHVSTFRKAISLTREFSIRSVEVPYLDMTLPGYFFFAGRKPRPTVFMPCGYDSTAESAWYQIPDAIKRGYNVIVVEGPGQGGVLYQEQLYFRPDYELVGSAVLDWLADVPQVDNQRIAIVGRSFAGYLAPRAAANDQRFAALVCDPVQLDMGDRIPAGIQGKIAGPVLDLMMKMDASKREFFNSRMAAHGVSDIADYFTELRRYTFRDVAADIVCPTLIVEAENDFAGGSAAEVMELLTCDKKMINLTAEEGADGHCAGLGQNVWAGVVYDWLDEVLAR